MPFFLQFKTKSNVKLKLNGMHRYAKDESTEITHIVINYNNETFVWENDIENEDFENSKAYPALISLITDENPIYSFASTFQKIIYQEKGHKLFKTLFGSKARKIKEDRWNCLTEMCVLKGCLREVEKIPNELGLNVSYPVQNKVTYLNLINQKKYLSKEWNDKEKNQVYDYFEREIEVATHVWRQLTLPSNTLNIDPYFKRNSEKTRKMNEQGIRIDTNLCKELFKAFDKIQKESWFTPQGWPTSYALEHLKNKISKGRLYDFHRFFSSNTGRWSTPGFPLHSLSKPTCPKPEALEALNNINKSSKPVPRDEVKKIKGLMRACLLPEEGQRFFVADLKEIDARIIYWLLKLEQPESIYEDIMEKIQAKRENAKTFFLALAYGVSTEVLREKVKIADKNSFDYQVALFNFKYSGIKKIYHSITKAIQKSYSLSNVFRVKLPCGIYLNYGPGPVREERRKTRHGFQTVYYDGQMKPLSPHRVFAGMIQSMSNYYFQIKTAHFNANIKWTEHDKVIASSYEDLTKTWELSGVEALKNNFKTGSGFLNLKSESEMMEDYYGWS